MSQAGAPEALTLSSEMIARRIADAGAGQIKTASQIRTAVYDEALKHVAVLKGQIIRLQYASADNFYETREPAG